VPAITQIASTTTNEIAWVEHGTEHVADDQHLGRHPDSLHQGRVVAENARGAQHRVVDRQKRHQARDEVDPESHRRTSSKIDAKPLDPDLEDDREDHHEERKLDQSRDRGPQPTEVRARVARGERPPRQLRHKEAVARQGRRQPQNREQVI
jgi:hypothetical protein